jgi:hypothetical protein
MRALFLLLLAANLGLFAWTRHFPPADGASDPEPQGRQMSPEKIRILSGPELAGLSPPKSSAAVATTAPASTAPAATTPASLSTPSGVSACLEWGGFAVAEAPRAEQALAPLALGPRLTQRRSEEKAGWWVYIPPTGNRAAAMKKAAELKGLGVDEYFVLQEDDKLRWAVSLGVFSSEAAAKNRLETLKAKGVRSAQVGERETQVAKVWFQVRGADAALQGKLKETAQGLPGTEVRDCQS